MAFQTQNDNLDLNKPPNIVNSRSVQLVLENILNRKTNQRHSFVDESVLWPLFLSSALCLQDAFAKGEVFLGNKEHGYSASAGLPAGTHCNGAWQYGITIETRERSFLFTCEMESDQHEWLKHFNDVISAQMSPQEYTSKNSGCFISY